MTSSVRDGVRMELRLKSDSKLRIGRGSGGAADIILRSMLPVRSWGEPDVCRGPLVVMCHWLGGHAQTWDAVASRLAERGVRCLAVDLPGFGDAAGASGYSIREMADAVRDTVRAQRADKPDEPWLLAGHSMGGKVASVVAREAVDGAAGLAGLRGVVLLAASPPGPEPMKDDKRQDLRSSIGTDAGPDTNADNARRYVQDNTGEPSFGDQAVQSAVAGVLAADKTAIRAWLEGGSKEDWRDFVGELPSPSLVFAGERDDALGTEAQREQTLPHFPTGEFLTLAGAGHLLPLERPGEIAERIVEFCGELQLPVSRAVRVGERFSALLSSGYTSAQTRVVMGERLGEDDAMYAPQVFGRHELRLLRELVRRVVPGAPFDVAARVDRVLAQGTGDGWRYATLPEDITAWRRGLATLDQVSRHEFGIPFAVLPDELQDTLLAKAAGGTLGQGLVERLLHAVGIDQTRDSADPYAAAEMKLWFEDVRGELAKMYMADPRTMERVGFDGFADQRGFTQIRLGEREAWER